MLPWPHIFSLLKTDVHLFEWLLSYSLGTKEKGNTGLLEMESYAAVLNISVFLGPELSRIRCSSSTSSTNAKASLLVSASGFCLEIGRCIRV